MIKIEKRGIVKAIRKECQFANPFSDAASSLEKDVASGFVMVNSGSHSAGTTLFNVIDVMPLAREVNRHLVEKLGEIG